MLIFRYPHVKVLLLIILFITACSQKINPQQSIGASSSTPRGQYLQTKPINLLPDSREEALVALTFTKPLTINEAQEAFAGKNLKIRVAYLTNGRYGGTFAKPEPISIDKAFAEIIEWFQSNSDANREIALRDIQAFKESSFFAEISKNVDLANLHNENLQDMVRILDDSEELRVATVNFNATYTLMKDFENFIAGRAGAITGMQLEGSLQDIKAYANEVPTLGYTEEAWEMYSGLRPKNPQVVQQVEEQALESYNDTEQLYINTLEALSYLNISLEE